jgi:hemerythrin-like domain-containing protein
MFEKSIIKKNEFESKEYAREHADKYLDCLLRTLSDEDLLLFTYQFSECKGNIWNNLLKNHNYMSCLTQSAYSDSWKERPYTMSDHQYVTLLRTLCVALARRLKELAESKIE